MLAVPPAMLSALGLEPGASVGIRLEGERLVVERMRPRYSLDQLVAEQAEANAELDVERDDEWLSGPAVGREEI
jgi:antitoxin component of MazEF toxin-antitoxin module